MKLSKRIREEIEAELALETLARYLDKRKLSGVGLPTGKCPINGFEVFVTMTPLSAPPMHCKDDKDLPF